MIFTSRECMGFNWTSRGLTFENTKESLFKNFVSVLVVPSVDYLLPPLAACGFPNFFIENPSVWKSVFSEFVPEHERIIDELHEWVENVHLPARAEIRDTFSDSGKSKEEISTALRELDNECRIAEFNAYLQSWKTFLKKLAASKAGKIHTIESERWIYKHFISTSYNDTMHNWQVAICSARTIPDFLAPIIEEVYQIFNIDERSRVDDESRILYSRYYQENNLEGKLIGYDPYTHHHRPPHYAATDVLYKAFNNNNVSKVLRIFAQSFDESQVDLLVKWAEDVMTNYPSGHPEKLCGKELITMSTPFCNFPSVLELAEANIN
jgi:hypothetical protein